MQQDAARDTGLYTVTAVAVTPLGSPTSSGASLTLGPDALAGIRIAKAGNADYFSMTVGEPTHVRTRIVSAMLETDGALLDSRGCQPEAFLSEEDYIPGGLGFTLYGSLGRGPATSQ